MPVKVNHYKEMGLEDTSIIKRIANQVGLTIQKKTTKGGSKSTGAKNKSAGKSNTAKKKAGLNAAQEMSQSIINKQFMVSETITEPVFRYIPDRDTIQRLLHRCSNMKDDLAEFELFEDKDEAQAAEDEAAAAANEEEEEDE